MNFKRGQVTIFIILAIIIVGAIIFYFSTDFTFVRSVPRDMRPVYDYYLSCLEGEVLEATTLMGEQAGYIEVPEFFPGSPYAPGSSQLNFFGQAVPYWLYLSGNNILREQVPTISGMQKELNNYLEDRLDSCDFSEFEDAGYFVYVDEGKVNSKINENNIEVEVKNKITIFKDDNSVLVENHDFDVKSKLGRFYNLARKVLEKEKEESFLESYALDVMRLYAPVDGVEFSCVPLIFNDEEIRQDLYDGLEANMNSIKLKGDYYRLSNKEREYFVVDVGEDVQENVNFMYSSNWPTRIEIYGDRIVKPIGTQEGLESLGFCYVPYHLVYDINFPVIIQFRDQENFFQFPVSVIIDNNLPREAVDITPYSVGSESRVCEYSNAELQVYTYDMELNPVEATLSFNCLDAVCHVGQTVVEDDFTIFDGYVPTCVNAEIVANAPGYAQGKAIVSTNSESSVNILLKKEYEIELGIEDIGNKTAVVNFVGDDYSSTVVYPEMDSVSLVEGSYDINVYVYGSSVLEFPATKDTICAEVPQDGFGGFLGQVEEKCYDIDIPETEIDMAVVGGGSAVDYITELP
jgi:hypothetical protein